VRGCRERAIALHAACKDGVNVPGLDARPTGRSGCPLSLRIRNRVEESFGWMKTVGGLRHSRCRGRERTQAWGHSVAGIYISRAGLETQSLDDEFTQTELGSVKDDLAQLEQAAKIKDDRIRQLEESLRLLQENPGAVSTVLSLNPTISEFETVLRWKRRRGSDRAAPDSPSAQVSPVPRPLRRQSSARIRLRTNQPSSSSTV
jgi:hypothetical protein